MGGARRSPLDWRASPNGLLVRAAHCRRRMDCVYEGICCSNKNATALYLLVYLLLSQEYPETNLADALLALPKMMRLRLSIEHTARMIDTPALRAEQVNPTFPILASSLPSGLATLYVLCFHTALHCCRCVIAEALLRWTGPVDDNGNRADGARRRDVYRAVCSEKIDEGLQSYNCRGRRVDKFYAECAEIAGG